MLSLTYFLTMSGISSVNTNQNCQKIRLRQEL
jgi:hypothetical protein